MLKYFGVKWVCMCSLCSDSSVGHTIHKQKTNVAELVEYTFSFLEKHFEGSRCGSSGRVSALQV
jgi:bacterioferritin-associated ferredoxin